MKKTVVILNHIVSKQDNSYLSFVHSHAKAISNLGFKVITLASNSIIPFTDFFKKNNVSIIKDKVNIEIFNRYSISNFFKKSRINFNGLFYYIGVKNKFKKIIKENNVILIDAHNLKCEGYAAYLLKKKYGIKTTITLHGSDLEEELSYQNGVKRLIKISKAIDYFVCVSDKLKNKLNAIGIFNVVTIYNGIEQYDIKRNNNKKQIVCVGDFIESKNIDLLIKAFARFNKNNKEYKLIIIGDGELKDKYLNIISKLDIEDKVLFTGNIKNTEVYEYLSESYAFVLPSSPEGFGIVYAEAMYCGCITVGIKNEGIDGFIKNNVNGFLIDSNIDSIYKIMNYIIHENCDIIKKIAIKDTNNLTWKKNATSYLKLK